MDDVTRRSFVKSGAGAAAGLIAVGTFAVPQADAKTKGKAKPKGKDDHHRHSDPIVAWIGNPRDGHITVMSAKGEVTIHDHKLAARLARAAR